MSEPIESRLDADALDIIELFSKHDVRFMVVGAYALAANGISRATSDTDLWIDAEPANAPKVIAALTEFGAPLRAHGVTTADFASPRSTYQLGLPPRRIDFITQLSGISFSEAWPQRIEVKIRNRDVAFLGYEALIKNKRAAARPKDLLDVEILERAKR